MKKTIAAAAILLATATSINAEEHVIEMLNNGEDGMMVFSPGYLKVAKGDTVKFVASDGGHNTVSSFVPEGAETWSGAINEEVSVKMDTEGVYIYECTPHLPLAMVGVIQVGEAVNMAAAEAAAGEMNAKFMMAKERLDGYMEEVN